jgi:hypothetical protein
LYHKNRNQVRDNTESIWLTEQTKETHNTSLMLSENYNVWTFYVALKTFWTLFTIRHSESDINILGAGAAHKMLCTDLEYLTMSKIQKVGGTKYNIPLL